MFICKQNKSGRNYAEAVVPAVVIFFYIIVIIINSVDPAAPDLDADSGAIICSLMKTATMRV